MSSSDRGRDVLRSAESDLRTLVTESTSEGDYEGAALLVSWAQAVRDLAARNAAGSHRVAERLQRTPRKMPKATTQELRRPVAKATPRKRYPLFFRRKDQIVKVGWSKREKKEYQHKAPFAVMDALLSTVATVGADGRVFSTDQFLPLRDPSTNSEFPTYQVYVSLALLKDMRLIEQHGRQGYSIPNIPGFMNAAKTVLQKLTER